MVLFSLRQKERSSPLFKMGRVRFGQVAYPVGINHGETWRGQFSFKHTGPAETIIVSMGPFVEGVVEWQSLTMNVNRDEVETEYDSPEFSGPYDSRGLPHCRRIDTNISMQNAAATETLDTDSSTERFHNVVDISRSFDIIMDRYGSPEGWAPWAIT